MPGNALRWPGTALGSAAPHTVSASDLSPPLADAEGRVTGSQHPLRAGDTFSPAKELRGGWESGDQRGRS
jgi:hypothetical protein